MPHPIWSIMLLSHCMPAISSRPPSFNDVMDGINFIRCFLDCAFERKAIEVLDSCKATPNQGGCEGISTVQSQRKTIKVNGRSKGKIFGAVFWEDEVEHL